jgi:hypothetical protein
MAWIFLAIESVRPKDIIKRGVGWAVAYGTVQKALVVIASSQLRLKKPVLPQSAMR